MFCYIYVFFFSLFFVGMVARGANNRGAFCLALTCLMLTPNVAFFLNFLNVVYLTLIVQINLHRVMYNVNESMSY